MGLFFKNLFITLLAFIVASVLFVVIIIGVIAVGVTQFTPESEPLKRGTVLEINMNEAFVDSPQSLSLIDLRGAIFGESAKVSIFSMMRALEVAAEDPNISAISLRMDGVEYLPLATAEELRASLKQFNEKCDKPIYAYAESYSQVEYYLATVADKMFIHPLGQIEWQGVATNMFFYGDLIKGVGAKVEVFRPEACSYKSAVEPYTRSSMSDESREQNGRLVDMLWDGVVKQVGFSRQIPTDTLRKIAAERIVVEADEALKLGMIDGVEYGDIYAEQLAEQGAKFDDNGNIRRVTFAKYAANLEVKSDAFSDSVVDMGGDKIAIIYVDGTIVDGVSEMGNGSNYVGSVTIANQLRKARQDADIKGVVVRVNSPGGSAMAADVMWREMELLKKEKMVIVSMGSYAASGGYYISAPADAILADSFTLTGSIGVYGMMVDYAGALSNLLHVNIDGVGSEPSADFGRVPRAITPLERAAMMRSVDQVYESFTTKVSQGRNLPMGVVNVLSGGRVWSGVEAESCGLIDGLGGLNVALNLLIDRLGLSGGEYEIIEMHDAPDELEMLLSTLGVKMVQTFPSIFSGFNNSQIISDLRALEDGSGVMMYAPERLE